MVYRPVSQGVGGRADLGPRECQASTLPTGLQRQSVLSHFFQRCHFFHPLVSGQILTLAGMAATATNVQLLWRQEDTFVQMNWG